MKNSQTNFITWIILSTALLASFTAGAQIDQGDQQDYITIFEDCDYQGDRRALSVGDYNNMRGIDFGNDKISSIRVPSGVTVTIFEDDDYRGDSARINRSIRCFDKKWNDRVSSLSVDSDNRRSYQAKPNYDNDGRPVVGSDRTRKSKYAKAGITGRTLGRVDFGDRFLEKTGQNEWLMLNARTGASIPFREINRDENTVLLRSSSTQQSARIDLLTNDVTFLNQNGESQGFEIASAELALRNRQERVVRRAVPPTEQNPVVKIKEDGPSRVLRGPCFNYSAYTRGGTGGIRFHGYDGFHQFRSSAFSGRICGGDAVAMEINKQNVNTDVLVEIQGRTFRFAPNEKADVFRNTWYRKIVTLIVK